MKTVESIAKGENFSAIDIGDLELISEYVYPHPKLNQDIKGKVFLGEILNSTGVEISLQVLPKNTAIPFFHKHNLHEEVYFIIKGNGQFQIDDKIFNIKEGTLIRVSPEGKRTWRNNSDDPMIFMVIQSMNNSIDNLFVEDGIGIKGEVKWD